MLKPTANFKLSKSAKRILATVVNPQLKGALKKGYIQAELAAQQQPPRRENRTPQLGGQKGSTNSTGYVAPDSLT